MASPATGQRVRIAVRDMPFLHMRTPKYLQGKVGVVERALGAFPNPETRAYAPGAQDHRRLVRVRFTMGELWGDGAEDPQDTLDAEIYEHWLEPV